jgi:hypothetical protein
MRDISFQIFTASVTLMMDFWIFTMCSRNTRRPELKAEIAAVVEGISTETLAYMPSAKKFKFSLTAVNVLVTMCFQVAAVALTNNKLTIPFF